MPVSFSNPFLQFNLCLYIVFCSYNLHSKHFCASSSRKLGQEQKRGMTGKEEGREGNTFLQTPGRVKRSDCSRSAKLIAGRVNCSGQIISLQCFDKVSDEIKSHKVPNLT